MGRIVAVDYGMKRCGIAATDALKIAVHPVATVDKKELVDFIKQYIGSEPVEEIVFGHPELESGKNTPMIQSMNDLIKEIKKCAPQIPIVFHDENFTSHEAALQLVVAGLPKKKRQEKGVLDRMSAMLILKDYLGHY